MTDVVESLPEVEESGEILIVTDAARTVVEEIRAKEEDPTGLALRVEVTGANGVDYTYDLSLEPIAEATGDDHVYDRDGLAVIVPDNSVSALSGATLDIPSTPAQGGLVIRNPNRPNPLGDMGQLDLVGDVAEKVQMLLRERINPALESHGGFATFVGVEDDKVFITMGGGCQGCSMSAATLAEGIQKSILQAIPEVSEVIDATDHQLGDNPYYT